jgi:hypothetical protein
MQYLVLCTCYHNLELHDENGCRGDDLHTCECSLNKHGALNAAIEAASTRDWRTRESASGAAS